MRIASQGFRRDWPSSLRGEIDLGQDGPSVRFQNSPLRLLCRNVSICDCIMSVERFAFTHVHTFISYHPPRRDVLTTGWPSVVLHSAQERAAGPNQTAYLQWRIYIHHDRPNETTFSSLPFPHLACLNIIHLTADEVKIFFRHVLQCIPGRLSPLLFHVS